MLSAWTAVVLGREGKEEDSRELKDITEGISKLKQERDALADAPEWLLKSEREYRATRDRSESARGRDAAKELEEAEAKSRHLLSTIKKP